MANNLLNVKNLNKNFKKKTPKLTIKHGGKVKGSGLNGLGGLLVSYDLLQVGWGASIN